MIARGISESVMIAGRISQSSCRSRLSPPLWCPAGGLAFLLACLPCLWFSFLPPIPQPPSPVGKGETISLFRRGLRPRHPCIRPFATLTVPAVQVPSGVAQEGRSPADLALPAPAGGLALFAACLPCLWFTFLPPIPPTPFPAGEGGESKFSYARGFAPCIPGAEPARHRLALPIRHPAGVCLRNLQPGAKPKEPLSYEQCRQPRRGGTGGDGTIRRKRRRRLRWSSPPGQGNQVPQGEQPPPLPPPGTCLAGSVSAASG